MDLSTRDVAQAFTTGSTADAYEFTGVKVEFATIPSASATVTAFIADGRGATDDVVVNLTNPPTWSTISTFAAPDNTTLDASTTYYLIIEATDGILASTASDNVDSGGVSGWSIADARFNRAMVSDSGLGGTWIGSSNSLRISVEGDHVATAPEAPGNLTATAGTDADTMVLTWETPAANGNDITKFQVRYAQGSTAGGTWADILNSDADTTTHTVTELTAGTEYTFEVHAVNDIDDGAAATVTQTTATPAWELTISDLNGNAVTELVEGGASATVTVRITNGVTFSTAQTVTLEWDGLALDATNRIQGAGGASAITLPPGQSSGTLVISAPDPGGVAAYDPPRSALFWGRHGENQISGIDLTFRDDEDPPVATLTAQPAQVSEGGTINVEISLNLPFGAHATSTLSLVVTDDDSALVAPLPTEAAFDPGELTHALTLTADDNAVQNDSAREVTVALVENPDAAPHTLGEPSSVTVTVLDNDTPPSAPQDLTAEPGDRSVALLWTAPATDNGQAVTGYEYRQKSGTGAFGAWVDILGSNSNTAGYTVTGLTNGIFYTFEVSAENAAGQSVASNEANAVPAAGLGVGATLPPSAPQDLTAEPGDRSVTLQWTAPSNVTGYEYRQKSGTGAFGAWVDILGSNGNTAEYTVTGLTNGILYTFEIHAENAGGQSGPSNQASATPDATDTTVPVLQSATTTALELGLTYDEDLDAGSEPTPSAFTVTVNDVTRAVTGVALDETKVLLTLASAVRPGETVTVSYTKPGMNPLEDASDNEVESFTDFAVTNTLAATAPEAPGNLTASTAVADTMVLTWEKPWANGRDITKFQARHVAGSTAGGTWADILNSDADTPTHTVTGLTAGTQYTFEVRAVNGIGNGGAPATVTQTTATPTWELTLTDSDGNAVTQLTEGGPSATATVSIANGVRFSTDQTVALEWIGFSIRRGLIQGAGRTDTITIPAGESSGSLDISAPEPGGTASYVPPSTFALSAIHAGRQVGESIDLTFVDDEPPPAASIARAPTEVSEGDDIEIRISLNLPTLVPIGIRLAVTDTAGALSGTPPAVWVFAAFETASTVTLTAADNEVQNDGAREVTLTLALSPPDAFTLGEPSSVTVTVLDNDTPPSAPRNLAAEARDGEARLRWQAPLTDNGQAMTGYEYRHKAGTGSFGAWTDILGSNGNTTEYTVTGLANGTLYTFEVQAENTAGQSGPSNQASATPDATDTTAPVLMSATTTALELGLTYDEDLDASSEPAPSAFTVTINGASRGVTGVSVGDTKARLTLALAVRAGETVTVSYTVPMTGPLRDEARNPAAAFSDHPVTNEVPATAPEAPTGLEATPGDGSVTLRWTASAYDGGSEVTGHQYRQKTTGGFGGWQDIALSAPGEANATSYPVTSLANGTTYAFQVQAVNAEGESAESNQASATPDATDTTAPVLRSATTTALALALIYDEDLDIDSEPAPSAFTVAVDGASRAVTGVSVVGTKVLLTLAPAVRAGDLLTVSYTVPAMNPLRDEASNPAAAFSDHPVTNETPATVPDAPSSLAAAPGDGSVTLRWTASAHDGGSAVTGHQYRQKTTGGFGGWQDIALSAPGEANATSYPVTSLANGTTYTFQVQAVNAEGESAESNQASATPDATDTTAPVLRSATTTALALALTYDENLDTGSEPAPSAFTVTVNGATRAVTGVSVGAKVLLTLASAVRAGETVTVSYTVPVTNPLRDEASNPAAPFADHPVTNETLATVPDAPANLEAAPGDGSVTLRWTAPYDGGRAVTGHQYCREEGTSASCTAESDWQDIADSAPGGANATGYTVTRLTNGTVYTFRVRARNAEGESAPSPEAGTTPDGADTASPEVVRALSAGFGRMVGSQALSMVSEHLEGGGGSQVTVGGERLGASAAVALARLEAAARDGDEERTRTGREALLGSSFRLQSGGKETGAPGAAAWGAMAAGRFETRSDGVGTEGEVTTGMVGADVTSGRWLVGGALSHARGKGSFATSAERAEGESEVRLTTVHPYARVRLGERMSAWGLAGYGKGELALSGADGKWVETGLRMRMGAVGARGTLVPAPAGGGFELALKTDALWMRVISEAAEGLPGERADARRVRLVLDASRVVETAGGATLTPRFEAGVRRDGGDTQSGAGLEVGAGLRYARSAVTVEGRVRALALHEASGYEEWGASGSVRVDPSASGRGLSLTLAPTWGNASSAVERLWSLRDPGGLASNADPEPGARLDAELGYGLRGPRGVGVATPYAGLGLAREGERAWRAGARWNIAPNFTLGLEATRREPSANAPPEHRLMLGGALRW